MDATEAQKELVQLLLKRLKACALESASFRAAVFNFSEEARTKTMEIVEFYRQSVPIQQKVEKGFHDLDSLIQQVSEALDQEEVRRLLEQFDQGGLPN
jgi:sulfite reductase alpha subunit-like flavoprotein